LARRSSFDQHEAIAAILAFAAAISEEIFFRGFLLATIAAFTGNFPAVLISSLIFGYGHAPLFGSSIIVESLLGFSFSLAFVQSGGNLVVPILAHALYDIVTVLLAWRVGVSEIEREARLQASDIQDIASDHPKEFEAVAKACFKLMDINGDGIISKYELLISLRMFRFGIFPQFALDGSDLRFPLHHGAPFLGR
jgi:hypothetical protein